MTTIVPQMAKLSVKDLLETRQRLEADIGKLLDDFYALSGVRVSRVEVPMTIHITFGGPSGGSAVPSGRPRVEFDL
jgi:hypothetical protein